MEVPASRRPDAGGGILAKESGLPVQESSKRAELGKCEDEKRRTEAIFKDRFNVTLTCDGRVFEEAATEGENEVLAEGGLKGSIP